MTVGGRTGVCENAKAKLLPQYNWTGPWCGRPTTSWAPRAKPSR